MFISDKNVQDYLRYKHGLLTAEQLADLCNWPDVEYIRRWADNATFGTRHYEIFARTQRESNTAKAVGLAPQTYQDIANAMTPEKRRDLQHGDFTRRHD